MEKKLARGKCVKMAFPQHVPHKRVPDDKYGVIINASNLQVIKPTRLKCYAHIPSGGKKPTPYIQPATDKSWATFLRSTQIWKEMGHSVTWERTRYGQAADIARRFLESCPIDIAVEAIPKPGNAGFHRQCYQTFTDCSYHERAKKSLQKHMADSSNRQTSRVYTPAEQTSPRTDDSAGQRPSSTVEGPFKPGPATKKSRLLRSGSQLSQGAARSSHVLPDICILCRSSKYKRDNHSGVRRKEPLTVCERIDGGLLLTTARRKKDEDLLLHIENQDCVAIGLKYHSSCYKEYTKIRVNPEEREPFVPIFDKAYKAFCKDTIDKLIFKDKNVLRMTKLKRIFDRTVQEVEDQDSSGYRAPRLKHRLIKSYPELCFFRPKRRNVSELVYADSLTIEDVIEDFTNLKESLREEDSDSSSDSDAQKTHGLPSKSSQKSSQDRMWTGNRVNILRDSYSTALDMKRDITSIPFNHRPWPPTSSDLTVEDARHITPTKLFNFLAWVVGSSDEPEENEMVKVDQEDERKLLTMALDVIYMATRGKKSAPKDASSATAV